MSTPLSHVPYLVNHTCCAQWAQNILTEYTRLEHGSSWLIKMTSVGRNCCSMIANILRKFFFFFLAEQMTCSKLIKIYMFSLNNWF